MSRMTVASIHLRHQVATVWRSHFDHGSDGRRTVGVKQPKAKKGSRRWRLIVEKVRGPPLIRRRKIEPAVPIGIGNRDASRHHGFSQTKRRSHVVVSAIQTADKEGIAVVSA